MNQTAHHFLSARPVPLRLIIYDCDGVLIDSEPVADRLVAEALNALGWPITAEECSKRFLGVTYEDMCPIIETRLGRPLPTGWLDNFLAHVVRTMAEEAEPIPGARAALEATTRLGLEWRVASNSSHAEMTAKFARAGLTTLVAGRLHSAHDVMVQGGKAKPAPDLFLAAATAAGIAPTACLVVEDSPPGIRAALAAGMGCLALARHDDGATARALGAIPFADMHELPALLHHAIASQPC